MRKILYLAAVMANIYAAPITVDIFAQRTPKVVHLTENVQNLVAMKVRNKLLTDVPAQEACEF